MLTTPKPGTGHARMSLGQPQRMREEPHHSQGDRDVTPPLCRSPRTGRSPHRTGGKSLGGGTLGEPCRAARSREQSPGGRSVGSAGSSEDQFSSRRRTTGGFIGGSIVGPGGRVLRSAGTNTRDPRPVGDRHYERQCARKVVEFLNERNFGKPISLDKFLKSPSTKEYFDIFRFLIQQIDPKISMEGKAEDEIPAVMRRLKYPVEVNRSKLQAISGPNTWPQLLAVLDWLITLIQCSDELIQPVARCSGAPADVDEHDTDAQDQEVLRSLHENYQQYLVGKNDNQDEERLRMIYEERIRSLRDECTRLQDQQELMTQRVREAKSEHDRLIELQAAPKQLELEADRLRGVLQSQEVRLQRLEDEEHMAEEDEQERLRELEGLEASIRELSERVENQVCSKKDIERLKCERSHLKKVLDDLRADAEKSEQDVWELGIQESKLAESIGRTVRRVNDSVQVVQQSTLALDGIHSQDLLVSIGLAEPTDALAAHDWSEARSHVEAIIASQADISDQEQTGLAEVLDDQRVAQEEISEKESQIRRLNVRLAELGRLREEQRAWSTEQLDEAQRAAEATEDAVHAVPVGTGPSVRDTAEVDELRLKLAMLKQSCANEVTALQEQLRRDEERSAENRKFVCKELLGVFRSMEQIRDDALEAMQLEQAAQAAQEARAAMRLQDPAPYMAAPQGGS
eukprot:gnl/TRDRNA2_/TRDRNA2_185426_c0_seq1.p1 gnl/TRDRNA2_/TRDRNA2_185426_c0~~gnl/TRDRNA2_/TRDRNA2_185426_c0_seq1.p1  ORF type:complete len:686 (-),score=154.27 gnl/TRDRNA2_/TRDRNA2_185426_c0_seq1:127-2184(-)